MKISIIIPVYNAESYIETCLDSILLQSYKDYEVWIINDGSSDMSGEICDGYANRHRNFNVIHNSNHGVSFSRNLGISKSKGEYLLFVDSDDYINEDTLKILNDSTLNHRSDIVIFGFQYDIIDEDRILINLPEREFNGSTKLFMTDAFLDLHRLEFLNPPWNKLIKKSLITENDIHFNEDFSICEDMSFNMELLYHSKDITVLRESLYHYVIKSFGSLVFKFHDNYYEAMSYYFELTKKLFENNEVSDRYFIYIDDFFLSKSKSFLKKVYRQSNLRFFEKYRYLEKVCKDEYFLTSIKTSTNRDFEHIYIKSTLKVGLYWPLHIMYVIYTIYKNLR